MPKRLRLASDDGETLLELVISIAILGISVVAIAGSIALGIKGSVVNRNQASASSYLRDYAEAFETAVAGSAYTACGTTSTPAYSNIYTAPSPFQASLGRVEYWTSAGAWATSGCTPANDTGVQRLTLQVASGDSAESHGVVESLVIIVRKPCGTGSSCT